MYLKNERAGTLKPKSKTLGEPQIPELKIIEKKA